MPVFPLFAEMNPFELRAETVVLFFFTTTIFLALCGGVLRWSRTVATKLIALGLLAAVVSVAYNFVTPPTTIPLTNGLMKIAVILVLGGVACSVVSPFCCQPPTDATRPKEPIHE